MCSSHLLIVFGQNGKDKIVPGLYAAGEAACVSVHGANRLGANSLLDLVVFGRACAHHIIENLTPGKPHKAIPEEAGLVSVEFLDQIRNSNGPKATADIRLRMQKVMQSNAALFRYVLPSSRDKSETDNPRSTQQSLDEGVQNINQIYRSFNNVGIKDRSMIWNSYGPRPYDADSLLTPLSQ